MILALVPLVGVSADETATVVASKIVCDSEADLPNWGNGGSAIVSTTAEDWVGAHPNCHLEEGWNFQWAADTSNPGDNTESAGDPWITFGPTDSNGVALVEIPATSVITWFREILQPGFISFSGWIQSGETPTPTIEDAVSAEIYCSTDVLNYDNYDLIDPIVADQTYYCVAFNAPIETPPITCDPGFHEVDNQCVEDEQQPVIGCTDDTANNFDSEATEDTDPTSCTYDQEPTETPVTTSGGGGASNTGGHHRDISNLLSGTNTGGEVLGASTGPVCEDYLKEYIKYEANNNPEEVKKLQIFLNQFFEIDNPITGFYGPITQDMVNKFQMHQEVAVLTPWTIAGFPTNGPTGYVYKTTKRWINILKCPESIAYSSYPSLP